MSTKGYFNSFGPYSEEIYYVVDDNGTSVLDKKGRKIRVRVAKKECIDGTKYIQYVRDGWFGRISNYHLKKE